MKQKSVSRPSQADAVGLNNDIAGVLRAHGYKGEFVLIWPSKEGHTALLSTQPPDVVRVILEEMIEHHAEDHVELIPLFEEGHA